MVRFQGKTTLMDKLLAHCGTQFNNSMERAMDSNEHEKVEVIQRFFLCKLHLEYIYMLYLLYDT